MLLSSRGGAQHYNFTPGYGHTLNGEQTDKQTPDGHPENTTMWASLRLAPSNQTVAFVNTRDLFSQCMYTVTTYIRVGHVNQLTGHKISTSEMLRVGEGVCVCVCGGGGGGGGGPC